MDGNLNILYITIMLAQINMGWNSAPMAKEWARKGMNTILAASYSHLREENPQVRGDFQEENVDGITYC